MLCFIETQKMIHLGSSLNVNFKSLNLICKYIHNDWQYRIFSFNETLNVFLIPTKKIKDKRIKY